jgi:hypothetical protein
MKTLNSIKKVGLSKFEYFSFAGIAVLLLTVLVGFIAR